METIFSLRGVSCNISAALEAARVVRRSVVVGAYTLLTIIPSISDVIRMRDNSKGRQVALIERAAQTAWELGPVYVKLAQSFSSRMDIFPPAVCAALRTATVDVQAGGKYRGSIATVKKTALGGREVAEKCIDPRSAELLETDVKVLRAVAGIARSRVVKADYIADLMEEFTDSISVQADLRREARSLEWFKPLEDTLPVTFPDPISVDENTGTLVMTWLPGQGAAASHAHDDSKTAKQLISLVFEMLFVHGFIHCDLHSGNWWMLDSGRLAVVDAGFCYEIDDDLQQNFGEFFLGLAAGNGEMCSDQALAVCKRKINSHNEAGFRSGIQKLVKRTSGQTAQEFSLASFARELFELQRRFGAHARAEFIFPFVALLAVEGQVKQMDPQLNFQSIAGPIVLRGLMENERRRARRR